jgi:hypothetical protein
MLTVDVTLPDAQLRAIIAEHCGKHGTVKTIRILRGTRPCRCVVEMASQSETESLYLELGDSRFGHAAVIMLQMPNR